MEVVSINRARQSVVVSPRGDLAARDAAEEFRDSVLDAVDSGAGAVVVNLGNVERMSGHGVSALLLCYKRLSARGVRLSVRNNLNEKLSRRFDILKLNWLLEGKR